MAPKLNCSWDCAISSGVWGTSTDPLLPGFLAQLQDDGFVETNDGLLVPWDSLFEALQNPGYSDLPDALSLPPVTSIRPIREYALSNRH